MEKSAEFDAKGCYSYKKISAVTLPILVSMLMEHIIGMTDTAFLGRVSEVALGASALGTVYFLAFFVLGSGFSFGAQILIARRNGEKNFKNIGEICFAFVSHENLGNSLRMSVRRRSNISTGGLTVLFSPLSVPFSEPFMLELPRQKS